MRLPTASLLTCNYVDEWCNLLPPRSIRPGLRVRHRPPRPGRTRSQRSSRAHASLQIIPGGGHVLRRAPSRPFKNPKGEPVGDRRGRRGDGVGPSSVPRAPRRARRRWRRRRRRQRLHDYRVLGRYPPQRPVLRDVRGLVGGPAELAALATRRLAPARHVRQGAGEPGGVPRYDVRQDRHVFHDDLPGCREAGDGHACG